MGQLLTMREEGSRVLKERSERADWLLVGPAFLRSFVRSFVPMMDGNRWKNDDDVNRPIGRPTKREREREREESE